MYKNTNVHSSVTDDDVPTEYSSNIRRIARVLHEANRAYCESIGDFTQSAWASAPAWQQESVVAGVKNLLANPDATPEDSHANWLLHKKSDGWVYGPIKDEGRKEHPCIVPYSDLPDSQKLKDAIFVTVFKAMAIAMGLK